MKDLGHRRELIDQASQLLVRIGVEHGIIMSGHKPNPEALVQVASVQTLARRTTLPEANLVIIDESHHAKANSYKKLWEQYPQAKFLGVTATPIRLSGEGFDDLFEVLITTMSIKEFTRKGFLAPVKHFVGCSPDLKKVKIQKGDFASKALSDVMLDTSVMASLTDSYQKYAPGKSMIVFAVNVEHSLKIVQEYRSLGISAEHIDAKTPKAKREQILSEFKTGRIQVISNVEIVTEGFDFPACECVQLARPTQSLALFLQMVGRVMRPNPGKENGIILDNAGLWRLHGLASKDRSWSLKGKKTKGRLKPDEEIHFGGLDEEGILREVKPQYPIEAENMELIELTEELLRLCSFQYMLEEVLRKEYKLYSAYLRYRKWVEEEYHQPISEIEFEYIKTILEKKNREIQPGKRVNMGAFYHQEKELKPYWNGEKDFVPEEKAETFRPNKLKQPIAADILKDENTKKDLANRSFEDVKAYEYDYGFFGEYEVFYSNENHEEIETPTVIEACSEEELIDIFKEGHPGCFIEGYRKIEY